MKNGVLNDVAVAVAVTFVDFVDFVDFVAVTRLEFVDKLLRINKAKKIPRKEVNPSLGF